jgi:hypothetical protein
VYCGATAYLCALEALAHSAMLPADMIVVQARIPNSLSIQTVEESFASKLEPPDTFQEIARPRDRLGKKGSYSSAVCAFGYCSQ